MSREVRRVPVDWRHPIVPNPYWSEQAAWRRRQGRPESRLHPPSYRFVGLCGDYDAALDYWVDDLIGAHTRSGHSWRFGVEYHLTGYKGRDDTGPTVHPYWTTADDGTETAVDVRDEDHLQELLLAQVRGERPKRADYMPAFRESDDELGWCLYETVSEGTPVTPVFATAGELIEHLATVGQDCAEAPMRRAAAEALVADGSSMGSFLVVNGQVLDSSNDADKIQRLARKDPS